MRTVWILHKIIATTRGLGSADCSNLWFLHVFARHEVFRKWHFLNLQGTLASAEAEFYLDCAWQSVCLVLNCMYLDASEAVARIPPEFALSDI